MSILRELGEQTASVAESAGDAVVGIGRHIRGAGVVVGDGLVLTNAHNLRGPEVAVTFADARVATGTVTGADTDGDLAVIRVETAGAPALSWSGVEPTIGAAVFALARSHDGSLRATAGQISSVGRTFRGPRGRRLSGAFEHTAPLARGSSGGPVLDADGRLVGVNTHRLGDGFYLAVAADETLRARVDALAEGKVPRRRLLGIAVAPGPVAAKLRRSVGLPPRDGLLVRDVDPDGPAAAAGIEAGDLLVRAAERNLAGIDDLHIALDALGDADTVELTVVRGVEERTVTVSFADSGDTAPDED